MLTIALGILIAILLWLVIAPVVGLACIVVLAFFDDLFS